MSLGVFFNRDFRDNLLSRVANDAFEGVKVLVDKGPVTAPLSEVFNDVWDDSSDDEFDAVVEKATSTVI